MPTVNRFNIDINIVYFYSSEERKANYYNLIKYILYLLECRWCEPNGERLSILREDRKTIFFFLNLPENQRHWDVCVDLKIIWDISSLPQQISVVAHHSYNSTGSSEKLSIQLYLFWSILTLPIYYLKF